MTDPLAQGPNQTASGDAGGNGGSGAGVEQRFAELTRQAAEAQQQVQQLMQVNQQLVNDRLAQQGQTVQEQAPEMDPEEKAKLDYYLSKAVAPLQQQLQQTQALLARQQLQQQFASVPGLTPQLQQRALQLQQQHGLNPQAALTYALGEAKQQEMTQAMQQLSANQQRQNFNAYGQQSLGGQMPTQLQQNGPPPLPANFNQLHPQQQLDVLRARGVEDMPL